MTALRSYLIVDDSLTARMKLRNLLASDDVHVDLADSARSATERAHATRPDVALVDVVLPDADGVNLCKSWQDHPELCSIPVLLMSGERSGRNDRLAGLRSGAMGYLVKPFDDQEVLAMVETLYRLRAAVKVQKVLNEELSRRNAELRDFAHIVAHDLKAPVRAIASLVDCIELDHGASFGGAVRGQLSVLRGRAARLHELIGGILRYSEAGAARGRRELLDAGALVRQLLESVEIPAHVDVQVAPDLPYVMYDRAELREILAQLVGNAVRFMDKPQGRVYIACEDAGDAWRFSITDNGPGVPEHLCERVFQIFQTLVPRDERECTGVGLAIVKKLVSQNGGSAWAVPLPREGSRFLFTVPKEPTS